MPYVFNPFTGTFDDTVPLENGQISSNLLPSYVDDVLEYADFASFPATGETGKIYLDLDSNSTYRWSGSQYIGVSNPIEQLSDLIDVDTSTVLPANGQGLVWDNSTFHWEPGTVVQSETTGITGASAITNCVQISQANYDAIGTPDANTLYVIV